MWYGWQILIPAVVADGLLVAGYISAIAGSSAATAFGLLGAGTGVRGLAGPIVHFANGQPLKALASFAIEGVVPGVMLGASTSGAHSANGLILYIVFPITLVSGLAVDVAALARKKVKPTPEGGPLVSLAPLVVPRLHPKSSAPVGLSLVGRF